MNSHVLPLSHDASRQAYCLGPKAALGLAIAAITVFHVAWLPEFGWVMALFPCFFLPLIGLPTLAQRFLTGITLGLALYAPPLGFFWTLFGPPAAGLWLILALWPALFLVVAGELKPRVPVGIFVLAVPILWTGLEYFRSELYFLRFSWLSPGYALAWVGPAGVLSHVGIYGVGTLLFGAAAILLWLRGPSRAIGLACVLGLLVLAAVPGSDPTSTGREPRELQVAGAQIEEAEEERIPAILDQLLAQYPKAELIVLPEYSLDQSPSSELRAWCARNRRHVVVGGREPVAEGLYRNTAWVLDDRGEIVFSQAKSVPIQFFADGLPATRQEVWRSPWGALGIAICYDFSYTRVVDRLARLGAQAMIVPTMDSIQWGEAQHTTHARVPPTRAAEYRIPVVRSASSGISQIVDARGKVTASAPFADTVRFFGGPIRIGPPATLPWDRYTAPVCSGITAALVLGLAIVGARRNTNHPARPPLPILPR